jgi:hypothetical protein
MFPYGSCSWELIVLVLFQSIIIWELKCSHSYIFCHITSLKIVVIHYLFFFPLFIWFKKMVYYKNLWNITMMAVFWNAVPYNLVDIYETIYCNITLLSTILNGTTSQKTTIFIVITIVPVQDESWLEVRHHPDTLALSPDRYKGR